MDIMKTCIYVRSEYFYTVQG